MTEVFQTVRLTCSTCGDQTYHRSHGPLTGRDVVNLGVRKCELCSAGAARVELTLVDPPAGARVFDLTQT
jgi:hypothetical protein